MTDTSSIYSYSFLLFALVWTLLLAGTALGADLPIGKSAGAGKDRERQRCLQIKQNLFEDVTQYRELRKEWERFVPIYVKTQLENVKPHQNEVEFPMNHNRFNILGPMGKKYISAS